jgi:hypothetical protein
MKFFVQPNQCTAYGAGLKSSAAAKYSLITTLARLGKASHERRIMQVHYARDC